MNNYNQHPNWNHYNQQQYWNQMPFNNQQQYWNQPVLQPVNNLPRNQQDFDSYICSNLSSSLNQVARSLPATPPISPSYQTPPPPPPSSSVPILGELQTSTRANEQSTPPIVYPPPRPTTPVLRYQGIKLINFERELLEAWFNHTVNQQILVHDKPPLSKSSKAILNSQLKFFFRAQGVVKFKLRSVCVSSVLAALVVIYPGLYNKRAGGYRDLKDSFLNYMANLRRAARTLNGGFLSEVKRADLPPLPEIQLATVRQNRNATGSRQLDISGRDRSPLDESGRQSNSLNVTDEQRTVNASNGRSVIINRRMNQGAARQNAYRESIQQSSGDQIDALNVTVNQEEDLNNSQQSNFSIEI